MRIGLRVDVDTLRGTARGVPALLRTLERRGIAASFFFSVGPDNMGRHLWRLARPAFLAKMLRSRAPRLYGWDIVLRGTLGPGPLIARRCGPVMRATAEAGHEIGLHAWDHHAWQTRIDRLAAEQVRAELQRGVEALAEAAGRAPTCAAAPGWRCTDAVLEARSSFSWRYASDCRGDRIFRPSVGGRTLGPVQVPTTLPTYDELIGRVATDETYNDRLIEQLDEDGLNVLTVHAEAEGLCAAPLFDRFLDAVRARGAEVVPLGALLEGATAAPGRIGEGAVPGREGTVACLEPEREAA